MGWEGAVNSGHRVGAVNAVVTVVLAAVVVGMDLIKAVTTLIPSSD